MATENESGASKKQRLRCPRLLSFADKQDGFAIAPILYILMLIGVGAGILFSGYSQILRTDINITSDLTAKRDTDSSATTLSASSVLGSDGLTLCPPPSGTLLSGSYCTTNNPKLVLFGDGTIDTARLPANYATATSGAPGNMQAGVFAAGAGLKQLDRSS